MSYDQIDPLSIDNYQGGHECCRPIPNLGMRSTFRATGQHRQQRLASIDSLYLRFLVDAEHDCVIGRIQVQPHDVADLVDEERIIRESERLGLMRREAKGAPDPSHG